MGHPGNRGSWGPCVLDHTQKSLIKKPMKGYQGHFMGPPTDPGPLSSARVLKWSVRLWYTLTFRYEHFHQNDRNNIYISVYIYCIFSPNFFLIFSIV
ncbi:unnamed protein product, partial [Staurois parvus]